MGVRRVTKAELEEAVRKLTEARVEPREQSPKNGHDSQWARYGLPIISSLVALIGGGAVGQYGEADRAKEALNPVIEFRVGEVEKDLKAEIAKREAADARAVEAASAADKLATRYGILEGRVLNGLDGLTLKVQGIETALAKEEGRRSAVTGTVQ
jgi:hypothetical protein